LFLLPFLALQQDMSLSPPLQQSFMSQQASVFWLLFCGVTVNAAAETANAAAQAKLISTTLTFLIVVAPDQRIALRNSREVVR